MNHTMVQISVVTEQISAEKWMKPRNCKSQNSLYQSRQKIYKPGRVKLIISYTSDL